MSEVPILSNIILSLEIANSTVSLEIVTEEKSIDWDIRNLSSLGWVAILFYYFYHNFISVLFDQPYYQFVAKYFSSAPLSQFILLLLFKNVQVSNTKQEFLYSL